MMNGIRPVVELFEKMDTSNADLELLQKIAFSYQQLGNIDKAIGYYERADLISPNNPWILKRFAFCLRLQNKIDRALRCYEQLSIVKPSDIQIQLNVAFCMLELGQTQNALAIYYKLEFEKPNDDKIMRALAWCLFMERNYLQAEKYWSQVLALKPLATDYLNAAHVAWCMSKRDLALMFYKKSKELSTSNREFWDRFREDEAYLIQHGVSSVELTLLMDAI